MALDIGAPSASKSSANGSRATSSTSSAKSSSSDIFSLDRAATDRSPAPKPSTDHVSGSSSKPKSPDTAAEAPARAGAGKPDSAHAASKVSTATAKGRVPTRGTAAKSTASPAAPQTPAGSTAELTDPAKNSGLSVLQLLAQALDGRAAPPSTDSAAAPATDKPADNSDDSPSNDSSAMALALFSQSLAAALGIPSVTPPVAAPPGVAAAATGDATTNGVTDATQSTNGSSLQDLVSLLTHDAAAESKSKSGTDMPQFDVAAAKNPAADTSAADAAATGANSLAHLGVASHFAVPKAETNTFSGELRSAVGTAAWNDELGGQLTWMTHQGLESGSLKLSPEHLGPLEVHISVQNGAASVWFGANHADTRAALEQALPQLREMFANQGLTLTDSGVSRESPRNQSKATSAGVAAISAIGGPDVSVSSAVRMSLGLVDTYA